MPDLADTQNAILELARQRRSQREQDEARQSRQAAANPPMPKEEDVKGLGFIKAGAEAASEAGIPRRTSEQARKEVRDAAGRMVQGFDDLARVTAGPAGDALEAAMTEDSMADTAAKTGRAADRLGEGLSTGAMIAGQIGQAAALPGAAFATPLRAGMTGGALGAVDSLWDRMSKNEPLNDQAGVEDMVGDALKGASGGFVGFHIGKHLGTLVSKFAGSDRKLATVARRLEHTNARISDEAGQQMRNSGVQIHRAALARMWTRLRRRFDDELLTNPRQARHAWTALNMLGSETGRAGQIPTMDLTKLNQLRKNIQRSVRKPSGELSDSVNDLDMRGVRMIIDEMNNFIRTLPQRPNAIAAGNAKEGVAGWERMNRFFEREARMEMLSDAVGRAERVARKGDMGFEEAVRKEFFGLVNTKAGIAEMERQRLTPAMRKAIEKVAYGDFSDKVFNAIDKTGTFNLLFESIRRGRGMAIANDAARLQAAQALEAVSEVPGAGMMGMAGPLAGGIAGGQMPGIAQSMAPQTQAPPQRTMQGGGMQTSQTQQNAPAGGGGGARSMRPLQGQGMPGAVSSFPEVPGLKGTKVP